MQVVYLLLGSEQGLKEAYLKELLVKMDAFKSKVLVTKIFLSELSVVEFVEKLFSNSFFSEKEIFIVYESELLKAGKDLEHITSWISFVRFENTFSLFNSILKKDMEHSLIKIKSILDQGEDFLSVLMSLIWQFKRLLKVQIDYSTCGSLQSALNKNKIFFSLNKIYRVGVKNYSIEEIKIVLKILYKFDLYLRIYSKNIHQNLSYFLIFSILFIVVNIFIEFSFIANSFILFASLIFTFIFSEISFSLKGNISL